MGSQEILLLLALFLFGLGIYLFVSVVLGGNDDEASLQWADEDAPDKSKNGFIEFSRPLAHRFAMNLAKKFKNPGYRKKVEKKILTAGLSRELNVDEFIAMQFLWGLMFPVLMIIFNFALELELPLIFFPGLALTGIMFPHIHCNSEKNKRYSSVIVDLPFFIDILALATEAGMDFIGAIQKVVEKAKGSTLASELEQVIQDTKLGRSRAEALKDMAARLDISEITSFVAVLVDADATGASIGTVLKQQSEQMRAERFARAEKAGARASQLILVPMMMFILPAVFIMVFGPIILQFVGVGGS